MALFYIIDKNGKSQQSYSAMFGDNLWRSIAQRRSGAQRSSQMWKQMRPHDVAGMGSTLRAVEAEVSGRIYSEWRTAGKEEEKI